MTTGDTNTTQTAPAQAADSGLPFQGATRSGLNIISKGGVEVKKPQETPSPGANDNNGNTNDSTNATSTDQNNHANTPEPVNQDNAASTVDSSSQAGNSTVDTAGASTGDPAAQVPSPDLLALFADRSGGKITKPEDALSLVDEVSNLRTQLAERPKIEFPNDQARQIYEFTQKFPGLEMAAAKNLLHIQTLPIDKLEAKDAQFEAFALKKPNWTREQAREYFEEKYEKAYGGGVLETSRMAQLDHDEETAQARVELAKMQQEFAAAKPSQQAGGQQSYQLTPEQQAEIQRNVQEVTKDFVGVPYQFVPNDPNSIVNVQMDKSRLQRLQDYLTDPGEFLKDLYEECKVNGTFSQAKLRDAMFEFMNRKQLREQVFNQGKVYGEITIIKDRKNTAVPKTSTDTPAPVQPPASYKEAFRSAVKVNRVKI